MLMTTPMQPKELWDQGAENPELVIKQRIRIVYEGTPAAAALTASSAVPAMAPSKVVPSSSPPPSLLEDSAVYKSAIEIPGLSASLLQQ
jgi:hypothetical protein